jgi:hypothetical protein
MDAVAKVKALREKRHHIIEAEGIEFTMVAPTVFDMIDAGFDPIIANITVDQSVKDAAMEKQQEEFNSDLRKFQPLAINLLKRSMVSPRLHVDEDTPCPDDAVTPQDLGNLVIPLAMGLMQLLNEDVEEVGTATAKFRMDSNGEAPDSDGPDVRDESAGHPGDGSS